MTSCAVGPCQEERAEGSSYCPKHGPKVSAKRSTPATGDSQIVCPHCQTRGKVRTKKQRRKVGVSGGKATGAVLTSGLSLFATGLSRKQTVTEARCGQCGVSWVIE